MNDQNHCTELSINHNHSLNIKLSPRGSLSAASYSRRKTAAIGILVSLVQKFKHRAALEDCTPYSERILLLCKDYFNLTALLFLLLLHGLFTKHLPELQKWKIVRIELTTQYE